MNNPSDSSIYISPTDVLEQGDIFQTDLVLPFADSVPRIFRTRDGRHGSFVFEEPQTEGRVFSPRDIDHLMRDNPGTGLRGAFETDSDGLFEMVVAFANRFRYFIIATQSCDLAHGGQKGSGNFVCVLPIQTIREICQTIKHPTLKDGDLLSIHECLLDFTNDAILGNANEHEYPEILKRVIDAFSGNKKQNEIVGRIKSFIFSKLSSSEHLYHLDGDRNVGVPQSVVDFSQVYTFPLGQITPLSNCRLARLSTSYRDDFAHKFGDRFSRIAVPQQMRFRKEK